MMCGIPKITSVRFLLASSWHHIFTFTCPFDSRKCIKERNKLQKFELLKNEKYFLEERKKSP